LEVGADGDVTPNYTVLESPTVGESYEVYITNNCGGTGVITTVEISICPEPENLEVTYVDETSPGLTYEVLLTWDGDAGGEYNVEYTVDGDTSYLVAVGSPVTGLSVGIEGLEYGVLYEFRVQRVCDTSSESTWAYTTFVQDYDSNNAQFRNLSGDAGVFFVDVAIDNLYGFFDCTSSVVQFPLEDTETAECYNAGFTGIITVKSTIGAGDFHATLYKNNGEVECIDLPVGMDEESIPAKQELPPARPEKQKKNRHIAHRLHNSPMLLMWIIMVVGVLALVMSAYHIVSFILMSGRPAEVALVSGIAMTLFSAVAGQTVQIEARFVTV